MKVPFFFKKNPNNATTTATATNTTTNTKTTTATATNRRLCGEVEKARKLNDGASKALHAMQAAAKKAGKENDDSALLLKLNAHNVSLL